MLDIDTKTFDIINKIITPYKNEGVIFYVFGSRITNTAKKYSDLDIAIKYNNQKYTDISKIQSDFENSNIPIFVDVIDLNNISINFYKKIKKDLYKI